MGTAISEDALLSELRFEADIYQLGQYTPVSMRDQIVRASYLVDRLWRRGILNPTSTLSVIGGGVAGITTTLRALAYGVAQVDMIEQGTSLMSLQAKNTSRIIDPVQYDWPASHWEDGKWPLPEARNPRKYTAVAMMAPTDLRIQSAAEWAKKFRNLMAGVMLAPNFRFHPKRKVESWTLLPAVDKYLYLPLLSMNGEKPSSVQADVVIFAGGFGSENTCLQFEPAQDIEFQSIPFWTKDEFQESNFGMKGLKHKVLVSGSGDGALQDYVRLVTGLNTCAEVLKTVFEHPGLDSWRNKAEYVWHWEDHAQRARRIARPEELHRIQETLHARYKELVENLVKSSDWNGVMSALDHKVGRRSVDKVYLAYKCNHFSWCYGLNHLVTLIVMAYARARSLTPGFEPGLPYRAALATQDLGHMCHSECWGKSHPVRLAIGVHCKHDNDVLKLWLEKDTEVLTYEGLVIRHGIDPTSVFGKKVKLRPQQIPFHLP